jgi:hypothetical protein
MAGEDEEKTEEIVLEAEVGTEAEEKPEDGIEELKRQLFAEKAARQIAEQKAQAAASEVNKAQADVEDTNLHLVKSAIEQMKKDNVALKSDYADALRSGNFEEAAEIQSKMVEVAQNLLQLENGRDSMVNKPKIVKQDPPADVVEHFAKSLSPRSAQWIRDHPEYVKDQSLNKKMLLAHAVAVDDGNAIDSDGYFAAIESRLGLNKTEENTMSESSKTVHRRDAAPAAAPVSRGNERTNVVRLSAEEREVAELNGLTPEQYAKHKVALKKEGRMQ